MTFLIIISVIWLSMMIIPLAILCVYRHPICSNNYSWLLKMDESVLEEKSYFNILELSFPSKLNWDFCSVSIAKTEENWSLDSFCEVSFS